MHDHIVDTPKRMDSFCQKMESVSVMAIDTEFLRVKTYYPKFCLMQICSGQDVYCIDPLAFDLGSGPLAKVLYAPDRTAVFHAARQDIEVLFQCFGDVPPRIFDTQVAAAMAGMGDQIGYANLVEIVTGRILPKAHTRTDWCQRPLSQEQVEYAVDDVRYLETVYEELGSELEKRGRLSWVFEECQPLSEVQLYRSDPDLAYKRIGYGEKLEPVAQSVLKELASWREHTSQLMDLPRNWVVKDNLLAQIAQSLPDSRDKLAGIEGVSDKFVRRHGERITGLVRDALRRDDHSEIWPRKNLLNAEQRVVQKQILDYLKRVAEDTGISQGLLGSRQDVARLVRGNREVGLLRGWRAKLLGSELEALLGAG
jgi:ribonuclease D